MFTWNKTRKYFYTKEEPDDGFDPGPPMPPVIPPKSEEDKALYTIGTTNNGNVALMVHSKYGYGTTTLTMNRAAVEHMVRQLQAALVPIPQENNNAEDS